MATFLRDQRIKNLSINTDRIEELFNVCEAQCVALEATGIASADILLSCIVRFDDKGYTVETIGDVLLHYKNAVEVERLVFTIETTQSAQTNRRFGAYMEVIIDKQTNAGYLVVSSDNQAWVNNAFAAVQEVIKKSAAWYGFIRTAWTDVIVQVGGVATVFLLSLLIAKRLAPNLNVENAFLMSFLFVFLLSVNVWAFLQRQVHQLIGRVFPNTQFVRSGKERLHWLLQGAVTGIGGTVLLYAIAETGNVLLGATSSLIKP